MNRDDAMRAAAKKALAENMPTTSGDLTTAGADAELARVVEWLREDGAHMTVHEAADALEARAHWPKESE